MTIYAAEVKIHLLLNSKEDFCILLTVNHNIIILFLFTKLMRKFFILIHLVYFCTCFEHCYAHLQEDSCVSIAYGIVTLFGRLFSAQVMTGISLGDCLVHRLRQESLWATV